ncbi:MAG: hypothetical protein PHT40_01455 [Patescibacteria group bacterium]|nr:hypothetical protein [Patescibacteria group bacterium]
MGKWGLEGFDTFEDESYSLPGKFDTQEKAEEAATKRLAELEKTQPTSSSGGQSFGGIQDQIYIIRPDGSKYRYFS